SAPLIHPRACGYGRGVRTVARIRARLELLRVCEVRIHWPAPPRNERALIVQPRHDGPVLLGLKTSSGALAPLLCQDHLVRSLYALYGINSIDHIYYAK